MIKQIEYDQEFNEMMDEYRKNHTEPTPDDMFFDIKRFMFIKQNDDYTKTLKYFRMKQGLIDSNSFYEELYSKPIEHYIGITTAKLTESLKKLTELGFLDILDNGDYKITDDGDLFCRPINKDEAL